ncbi:conserved Plasmodium protein, unknown function [Plasmodium knowlesi strain H]|uniref:Trigger factor C-terminal domain-containing protein n=3 Tax=Plasmodium knowlesi TaxID=5850 RepID=A0A5K1V148_PLAKH|nr:conserved Plasmodium protein, unknown function [Plasmodium knowlesi strain H]OTN67620.1 Uncharacterized protein PKNOH_S05376300 [Plasmodium knowlesi]CAA9990353.1 conserved Plasmodium protein, unknown function [Plasmodium knowlesi strain H]SBO19559.1 conserved Plasmodium protein, unknown function [Plasmodium knowlesi strain H]SBO22715.1 conserved Plasmodium protein, unknown function [Plasmodium knowlesi strain H]VVS79827.1 conserved Plasmodium protein, unknown function [Plasmodium knowlesi s|eukprot:XP_002260754.1 hypothetical protein, conserved in Plasmodium species [Plasmodium knowlesi strain H]
MVMKLGGLPKVFLLVCFILQHMDAILHLSKNLHVNNKKGTSKLSMSLKGRDDLVTGKRRRSSSSSSRFSARRQKYAKVDTPSMDFLSLKGKRKTYRRSIYCMGRPLNEFVKHFLCNVGNSVLTRNLFFLTTHLEKQNGKRTKWRFCTGEIWEKKRKFGSKIGTVEQDKEDTPTEEGVQMDIHENKEDGKHVTTQKNQDGSIGENEKRQRLKEYMQKELLSIEYVDDENERSEVQMKVHIKGSLREQYYDMCVKKYREKKVKENKYEYSYLKDVPINNLINYIKKEDYLDIFLKHVNEDIIMVYQKMNNLHLIGSPRLTNNINHLSISKFNDVYLTFSVDKFPKIKFNKSYIRLPMKVEIPPYAKGSTFKEFLKVIKNEMEKENEVIINVDENHKVDWNDDIYVNVCRGWVHSASNEYHNHVCGIEKEDTNKLERRGEESSKEEISDDTILNEAKNSGEKIKDLIDIEKTEEEFINSTEKCDEKKAEKYTLQNDENFFNDKNMKGMDECKYYDEFLQSSKFTKYFKEGYQLPRDVISMNGEVITVKENYNPLGLNESLIGMSRNEKKNVTAYLPVDLFKAHFDSSPHVENQMNCEEAPKVKDIDKESISKFREVIYTEIKKLKSRSFFRALEDILKSNQEKFFDREAQDGLGTTGEVTTGEATNGEGSCQGPSRRTPGMEDIEFILNDKSPLYDNDDEEEEEEEARSHPQSLQTPPEGEVSGEQDYPGRDEGEKEEEAQFNKNFDKYLEELLKDDINSLDEKIHGKGATSKTEDILLNVYDPSEYEKCEEGNGKGGIGEESGDDETINDYILGKCDLVKCILEVHVLDIKSRKRNEQDINDYVKKKYNKTMDELHDEVEERAMKDIQNKCVDQRRMEAYKKLMEISSLNVPTTLFHAQGKILYSSYLKKKKMQSSENDKNEKVLSFEEFMNKSQKEIYDQVKFSFIVKTIFQNAKLKVNYDDVIKDVLKTLLKTPTNNVKSLIKKIHTIYQAQCVLDFVSLNGDISFATNNKSSVNFSVTMKKGSDYTKEEFLNADKSLEDAQAGPQTGEVSPCPSASQESSLYSEGRVGKNETCENTPNGEQQKGKLKIFNFTEESNFVVENKKENSEQVELEYFTFKKGANYTKYFEEKYKKK